MSILIDFFLIQKLDVDETNGNKLDESGTGERESVGFYLYVSVSMFHIQWDNGLGTANS